MSTWKRAPLSSETIQARLRASAAAGATAAAASGNAAQTEKAVTRAKRKDTNQTPPPTGPQPTAVTVLAAWRAVGCPPTPTAGRTTPSRTRLIPRPAVVSELNLQPSPAANVREANISLFPADNDYFSSGCDSKFAEEEHLKEHMLQAHSDKPYRCDCCQAAFRYKGNLASHKTVHTGTSAPAEPSGRRARRVTSLTRRSPFRCQTVPLQHLWRSVQQTGQPEDAHPHPLRREAVQV